MTTNHLLLYHLAELMLEQQQHILPVDELFDDEIISEFVKSVQIDSPYQQMLIEGVLTETVKDEKLYVSFTVEGYFHFVLGEVLRQRIESYSTTEWVLLLKKNKLSGLKEGIRQCLIRQVQSSNYDLLLGLVDADSAFPDICIEPLILAFSSGQVKVLLGKLINYRTDHELKVLCQVVEQLYIRNRLSVVQQLLLNLMAFLAEVDWVNASFYQWKLRFMCLMESSEFEILEITDQLMKSDAILFSGVPDSQTSILLIDFYKLLVNKGIIAKSVEFADFFQLYSIEEYYITDNYYNFIYPLLEVGAFERAVELFSRVNVEGSENGYLLNWSGFIFQSWYELKSGDESHLGKALRLYEQSSNLIDKTYGRYSISKYENLENRGYTYGLIGEYEKALELLEQAIEIVIKTHKTDHVYRLGNLFEMKSQLLFKAAKLEEAMQVLDQSDSCKLIQVGADSSEMSWNYETRSVILIALNRKKDAAAFLKRALDIRIAEMGEDNDVTISTKQAFEVLIGDISK